MFFWFIAGFITVAGLGIAVFPLLRGKSSATRRSSYDLQIYRDQLKEIDADIARGTLSESEAKATRNEISRRLLNAAEKRDHETGARAAPKNLSRGLAVATVIAAGVGAFALYSDLGVPGLPDQPLAARQSDRVTQEQAELAYAAETQGDLPDIQTPDSRQVELVNQLREALKSRPEDIVGLRLLAENLGQIGEFREAREVIDRVVELQGDAVTASDLSSQAELLIYAAGFYVSPRAERALSLALQKDPKDFRARYYAGIAMLQRQRPDQTYRLWMSVLEESPEDAPWVGAIKAQIAEVARAAGLDGEGQPLAGPSAEDMQAASDMSEADRMEMIRGMVDRLSGRLASQGGSAAEWAQLIRALGVLGETARASAIWNEAETVFAADPAALDLLQQAARDAEVSAK